MLSLLASQNTSRRVSGRRASGTIAVQLYHRRELLAQAGWEVKEAELRADLTAAAARIVEHETAAAAAAEQLTAALAAADTARTDAGSHAASAAELQSRCDELSSEVAELQGKAAKEAEACAALQSAVERHAAEAAAERTQRDYVEKKVRSPACNTALTPT